MIRPLLSLLLLTLAACASNPAPPAAPADLAELSRQVAAAETAFAHSMADRDFEAFARHIADDAVFVNGRNPLQGKAAILADWKKYFVEPAAPFSWKPEVVVVLDSSGLAQTKGPVHDPAGKPILEFRSTWRREADGTWKVVFDDGTCLCPRPAAP